ncbi:MAG TPA: Fic family protein [Pseudobdellovibrionaceae bacterium]|nr:Fic family protein [Pseudobdellovibrionaceae bacterium]
MKLSQYFQYTPNISYYVSEISKIEGRLQTASFSVDHRLSLYQQSLAEASYYSTKIEGNPLTLKQVTESIRAKKKYKPTRSVKEVINYAKTRQFIFDPQIHFTLDNLLKSHDILLNGIVLKSMRGVCRTSQNVIKDASSGKIVYMPPEHSEVRWLLKNLIQLCHSRKDSLIVSALFHFHFESIHPFIDGNGRLGRLWANQILFKAGFTFVELVAIEKFHENHRKKYYESLHQLQGDLFYNISPQLDLTLWVEYWLEGLLFSVQEAEARIFKIRNSENFDMLEGRLQHSIKLFQQHKKLSASQYEVLLGVARTQAVADLLKLIKARFIKKVGGGRSTVYVYISQIKV